MLKNLKENIMSKSSKKLLITGGCSWTSPIEPYYKEAGMDKVWPDHVAEFFNWDLVNTAMGGASNEYIHGRVLDAIELNLDRDLVVMVNWSAAHRMLLYDIPLSQITFNVFPQKLAPPFGSGKIKCQKAIRELLQAHVENYYPRRPDRYRENYDPDIPGGVCTYGYSGVSKDDFYRMVMRWSIRHIYMLDAYCKSKGIPIIHHKALNIMDGIEWMLDPTINNLNREDVYKAIREKDNLYNHYFHKIRTWKNVVGGDLFEFGTSCYELYPKYYLSHENQHPNAQGMQLIAHSYVNQFIKTYEERATTEADYVYD